MTKRKQYLQSTTKKNQDLATRTSRKTGAELRCSGGVRNQGRIPNFKLGEAHLKKLRRAEGGAKRFGVFRVKNHDFTPQNYFQF
jgi:hypothetical protein